jgi:hypothetical protein
MALTFPGVPSVSYEYRVFMVREANESTFLHLSAEPMQEGFLIEVERPGSELDGRSVIVYSVLTHPLDGRPGIAYARESPRLVAHGLDGDPAGRSTSPTRGDSMSVQGGAQEPESPDQPDEQIPGQPGTMPDDDPSPVPEPPDMPSDPDRDPSQLPPDESGSS